MKIRFAASDRQSSAGMSELRERFEGLSIFRSLADSHRPIESFWRPHLEKGFSYKVAIAFSFARVQMVVRYGKDLRS